MNRWLLIICTLLGLAACESPPETSGEFDLGALLGGDDSAGYARATDQREFRFPEDHGAHRDYRSEWWYVTGQLADEAGQHYGFQLTFFRFGAPPRDKPPPATASRWHARDAWMAHFAVTDPAGETFHQFERFSRGAAGLAGASMPPVSVWLDNWQLQQHGEHDWQLHAMQDGVELALTLEARKPPVLHGDRGLSQKGSAAGNASWYYSLPRLTASGELHLRGERHAVSGEAWLDREWSTSSLDDGVAGWDWLSLQLNDGRELMIYRLRRADGSATAQSYATLIGGDGKRHDIDFAELDWRALRHWSSPHGGRYPVASSLQIKAVGIDLVLETLLAAQEINGAVRYWEGAVTASNSEGKSLGRGYLELTGYAE